MAGIKLQVDLDMVKFQTQLNSLVSKANSTVISPKVSTSKVSTYTKGIKTASTATESLGQKILEIPLKFFKWYAISGIVTGAFGAVRDGITDVISLDIALTNISFTMQLTSNELNDIAINSNLVANSLASTSDKVLEATQIYSNMNETLEEINDKSQASIILSNITGESITDMANAVQGSVYAFDLQADAAEHVADVMSKIASTTGVAFNQSIKSMTDSISIAGGVANEVGLSFEQFSAIVATTQEKTRMSGAKIASGLTTVFSRITRVSELGAEEISALEGGFKKLGITIRDQTTGEFLDMWEILQNINNVWEDLSSTERSYVAELSAGVRQRKVFLGVLNSMTGITERASDAMISSGFAMEQNDKFVESLSGKLNLLSEAQSNFFRTLIDSDTIGEFIDSLTSFLNTLTGIANAIDNLNLKLPIFVSLVSVGITVLTTKFGIFNGVLVASNPPLLALTAAVAAISFVYEAYSNKLKETTAQAERAKIAQEQYNKVMSSGSVQNIEDMNDMIAELAISYDEATTALSDYNSIRGDMVDVNLFNFANVSEFRELTDDVNEAKLAVDAFNLSEEELNKIVSDYKSKEYEIRGEADGRHALTSSITEQIEEYYDLLDAEKALEITRDLTIKQLEELSNAYPEAMESLIDAEISATDTVIIETQKRIIARKLELEAIQSLSIYSSKDDTIISQQNDYAFFRKNLDIIDESRKRLDELGDVKEKYFETSTSTSTDSTTTSLLADEVIALSEVNRQINLLESTNDKTIEQEKELKSLYNDKLNALSALADLYREQAEELDPLSSEYNTLQNSISALSVEYNELETEMLSITDIIEKQQDTLDDLVSAGIEALEKERDAILEAKEDEIDAIQDKIDALEEENDAVEDAIELAELRQDLADAESTLSNVEAEKNVRMLVGDEFVYVSNAEDVSDAEDDVADAEDALAEEIADQKEEARISELEAEIEALEEEQDVVEDSFDDRIDALEDYQTEYENQIESGGKIQESLLEEINDALRLINEDYFEDTIDGYQDMIDTINDIQGQITGDDDDTSDSSSSSSSGSSSSNDSSSSSSSTTTSAPNTTVTNWTGGSGTTYTYNGVSYVIKHDGLLSGDVTGSDKTRSNEIASILEDDEYVLTGQQFDGLSNILSSSNMLDISSIPTISSTSSTIDKGITITGDITVELPNVKDSDDLAMKFPEMIRGMATSS